jgi:hypothetical protein
VSKRKRPDGLRVGVTLYVRKGSQSLWENGIFQNCYFLMMLLAASPKVSHAVLINGGDGDPAEAGDFLKEAPAPVVSLDEAMQSLDVVIELSAQLDRGWVEKFKAGGGRVVGMRVANDYVLDVERMAFGLSPATLVSQSPYDVVWTLPAFEATCSDYYRAAMRAPVRAMQHLWSPMLVERSLAEARPGHDIAYRPGRKRWRLGILEPNISTVKTCHVPMLLCDVAHRSDPQFIDYLRVYNALTLKESEIFVQFARSLDLVQHGIATFEPRLPVFEILGEQIDAVVAHSWENQQNYIYYEALWAGYPLIHNSKFLDGCGYEYATFDCAGGALALRQAFAAHDEGLDEYRRRAAALLHRLDPLAPANVEAYGAALSGLFADG